MIIGIESFSDNESAVFDSLNIVNNFYRAEISNGIFDELHIETSTNMIYSNIKQAWQSDTALLSKFQNNLNAGNIYNDGTSIQTIKIKRKKATDFTWNDVCSFTYNIGTQLYTYLDKFVENGIEYTYAIVPIGAGGVEGNYTTSPITPDFDSTYIFDKNNSYHLLYNLNYSDTNLITSSATFEPVGSKFPIVSFNGNLDYHKGSLDALLVSDSTASASGSIDTVQERLNRDAIMSFLTNKKPKILKNSAGMYYMISIVGSPTLSYLNQFNQMLTTVKLDWVEIGESTNDIDLYANGLL